VTKSTGPDRKSKNAILAVLLKTWKNEGLEGFFRGFGANMISTFSMREFGRQQFSRHAVSSSERFCCWTCCSEFAYFFFHSSLRTAVLKRRTSKSLSTSLELLLGALAGALAQIFTIPVAVIATRQQLYERDASKGNTQTRDPSMFDTARDIIEESGVTGLWTGLKPGLVLTVNPAITYGVFEKLKGMVLAAAAVRAAGSSGDEEVAKALNLGPGWSFLLGMTSKTLATVVTYPYIFVSNEAFV
jgi:adenine nucleotide transporter 17